MFFFNPTTRLSIWERPDELENNDKIEEIVSKGPPQKQLIVESMYHYIYTSFHYVLTVNAS